MKIFGIQPLCMIIAEYCGPDVICDSILDMNWGCGVLSSIKVSYLSYIFNKYPTKKVSPTKLAVNPCLTPDLVDKLGIDYSLSHLYPKDKLLLYNPAYYTYCVENEVIKCLSGM